MLRNYQGDACNNAAKKIGEGFKKPLIISPTSSGKSFMIAGICQRAVRKGNRVLVLCHQAEILVQNEQKLNQLDPSIKTGIYCASAGRRDLVGDVIFASRDSIGTNLDRLIQLLGNFTFAIVDEAHLVPTKKDSRYQKIFAGFGIELVVGFTGTPWRLDNGKIWGPKGFFDTVAYNIDLDFLVDQGFIVPYQFAQETHVIDPSGVRVKSTGDYDERELTEVSTTDEVVAACLDKWESLAQDRRTSIFFCCSIAHAEIVTGELMRRLGPSKVGYIDGATKKKDREFLFAAARQGYYKTLVNVGVLTTGVDIPIIDCVVMLRATQSASLWVQSIGRALRTSPGKKDALIIDLTDNLDRFQSLAAPLAPEGRGDKKEESEGGEGPRKYCPECEYSMAPAKTVCDYCGHVFISHGVRLADKGEEKGWFEVDSYRWQYSWTRKGERCALVQFKLKDIKKQIKIWLLYTRDDGWGRKHKALLESIQESRVIALYVADSRHKDFPKVTSLKTSGESPVESDNSESVSDHAYLRSMY